MASSLDKNVNTTNSMNSKFSEFMQQLSGRDPKQIVQNLLNSGKMSQTQFNQYFNMAKQFGRMIK